MLYRKSYDEIKKWYIESEKALLIDGVRQVGKTTLIRAFLQESKANFIEFNLLNDKLALDAFDTSTNADELLVKLTALADGSVDEGTIFFIDEIQEAKDAITPIKFLVEQGDYRFIFSGSLLGVKMKDVRSVGVGYITMHRMFPMDFEEFILANGVSPKTIAYLRKCFEGKTQVDPIIHTKMLKLLNLYSIIGGMPEAVQTYVSTHNIQRVISVQNDIDQGYLKDITKYDHDEKLLIEDIYNLIPSELSNQNKRMILKNLNAKARFYRYEESFVWLLNSGVGLFAYNVDNPVYPLLASKERTLFKLFLCDVGILASKLLNGGQIRILNGDVNLNFGAIYEQIVAQELAAHGYSLFFSNNKKRGEIDFLIEENAEAIPIEVKSGKDYKRHSALNNLVADRNIEKAYILCNGNTKVDGKMVYLPVYMVMFMGKGSILSEATTTLTKKEKRANNDDYNNYYERYARNLLSFVVDDRYSSLFHRADGLEKDKSKFPDFIPTSKDFDVGFEVTRCLGENEGQYDRWVAENCGQGKTLAQIEESKQKHFKSLTNAHAEERFEAVVFTKDEGGLSDVEKTKNIDGLKRVIRRKLEILNSKDGHSQTFGKNELFVFINDFVGQSDIKRIVGDFDFAGYALSFDEIFLMNLEKLFVVGFRKNKKPQFQSIDLDRVTLSKIKAISKPPF